MVTMIDTEKNNRRNIWSVNVCVCICMCVCVCECTLLSPYRCPEHSLRSGVQLPELGQEIALSVVGRWGFSLHVSPPSQGYHLMLSQHLEPSSSTTSSLGAGTGMTLDGGLLVPPRYVSMCVFVILLLWVYVCVCVCFFVFLVILRIYSFILYLHVFVLFWEFICSKVYSK